MNKQEYTKWVSFSNAMIKASKDCLEDKKREYIEANVKHQIGDIVTVLDSKEKFVLRVKGYEITGGKLIPKFVTLDNKEQFVSTRAVIVE